MTATERVILSRFGHNATQDDIQRLREAITEDDDLSAHRKLAAVKEAKKRRFEPLIKAIEEVSGREFKSIVRPKERKNTMWKCIFIELALP